MLSIKEQHQAPVPSLKTEAGRQREHLDSLGGTQAGMEPTISQSQLLRDWTGSWKLCCPFLEECFSQKAAGLTAGRHVVPQLLLPAQLYGC